MNKATPAKNPGFEQKNRSRRRNRNCKIWPGFDRGRSRGRGPGHSIVPGVPYSSVGRSKHAEYESVCHFDVLLKLFEFWPKNKLLKLFI